MLPTGDLFRLPCSGRSKIELPYLRNLLKSHQKLFFRFDPVAQGGINIAYQRRTEDGKKDGEP